MNTVKRETPADEPDRSGRDDQGEPPSPPRLSTRELFAGGRQVVIEHADQEYVLLITRNGRLLLNRRS